MKPNKQYRLDAIQYRYRLQAVAIRLIKWCRNNKYYFIINKIDLAILLGVPFVTHNIILELNNIFSAVNNDNGYCIITDAKYSTLLVTYIKKYNVLSNATPIDKEAFDKAHQFIINYCKQPTPNED